VPMLQNAARIIRGVFEVALRRNWPLMSGRLLKLSKIVEKRLWDWEHPLRQFAYLPAEVLTKIEERGLSVDRLRDMDSKEIGKYSWFHTNTFGCDSMPAEQMFMSEVVRVGGDDYR